MKNSDRIRIRHDETVVISGASGRFPSSANLDEFRDNLFKGVDMVTADDTRWPVGMLEFLRQNFAKLFFSLCLISMKLFSHFCKTSILPSPIFSSFRFMEPSSQKWKNAEPG